MADGLGFSKHFGSGAGSGFSIIPDFGTYAFIGAWSDPAFAEQFFSSHQDWNAFLDLSSDQWGWDGVPIKGHGTWHGREPFYYSPPPNDWNGKVAVITRASIRKSRAHLFWWNVPASSRNIDTHEGLIYSKGIGETPLLEQATVSLWRAEADLNRFAYKSREHAPVVKKTRKYNWYSEEMFVRMAVTNVHGIIPGIDNP
jgi:hypothetical protein